MVSTSGRGLLVALALVLGVVNVATVGAAAQTNDAVAVNQKDGKSVFKLAFSVKKASGDIDSQNAAVAYSSCTDCRTVAVALQIVLVAGESDSVTPENMALAINYQCSECETLAAAYQYVFADGQELEFTAEGKKRLHNIKKEFHDLKQRDDLTLQQLADEIARIAAQVAEVVDEELVAREKAKAEAATTTTVISTTTVAGSGESSTTTTTSEGVESSTTTTTGGPTTTEATVGATTTVP